MRSEWRSGRNRSVCTGLAIRRFGAILLLWMFAMPWPSSAADFGEQQQLVEKARLTLEGFATDPSVGAALKEVKSEAKAIFIVPQFVRGAFVCGGAGGTTGA